MVVDFTQDRAVQKKYIKCYKLQIT